MGTRPSLHALWAQKLYSVFSAPLGLMRKTVPQPLRQYSKLVFAPPEDVVP